VPTPLLGANPRRRREILAHAQTPHESPTREANSWAEQNGVLFGLCCPNGLPNRCAFVRLLPNRPFCSAFCWAAASTDDHRRAGGPSRRPPVHRPPGRARCAPPPPPAAPNSRPHRRSVAKPGYLTESCFCAKCVRARVQPNPEIGVNACVRASSRVGALCTRDVSQRHSPRNRRPWAIFLTRAQPAECDKMVKTVRSGASSRPRYDAVAIGLRATSL